MENKIGNLIGAIAGFASPLAKNHIDRSQAIIQLKSKFKFLDFEHLPDKFGIVYAYTLVEYGLGKEESLLNIFQQEEIQQAFRTELEQNDLSILKNHVDKAVSWEFLDWNTLGRDIRELGIDIQTEIQVFRKTYYTKVLPRAFTPTQLAQNQKIQEILGKIDEFKGIDEIRTELKQVLHLLQSYKSRTVDIKQHNIKTLKPGLDETVKLYLTKSFSEDRFAELDQAGETDPERRTALKQVFIDLNVKTRQGIETRNLKLENLSRVTQKLPPDKNSPSSEAGNLSAIDCLLKECCSRVVIIGGPGQGKSTLGQQLAQVHRAKLLDKTYDFEPLLERIPFRVVLKYFAQWLADKSGIEDDDLEGYLAERVGKLAARSGSVSPQEIQEVFRCRPCVLILDGLDEVVVPELQKRMLSRIQDFLERAEVLGANMMVVATSRPNVYENQFEPEEFWHLELQPLAKDKVQSYAEKWVKTKNLNEEEENRIISTLEECQQDGNISALLTTPLQVTIILLVIKDGGRPPSQREALFHEYWSTIFRREKSKAKGIIQSDESILFDLHAYLGYLLQRRASEKNVQSLLPEEEFSQAIRLFLRKEDQRSSEEAINSKMKILLRDAQERLVLIVAPEPKLFGFELRSFQEFFAAVHLAQTATDTQQRFERLKAIACSQHWRNVALFFAGRISRNFRGEASNILELVCRSVDRGEPNSYLKPGAWLSMEIAADGALSNNRDLQYSAVEYGLKVLETSLIKEQQETLIFLTLQLPKEDRQDILCPVLEGLFRLLAPAYWETTLNIYAKSFGATYFFQEKIDILLQTRKESVVSSALNLALEYQSDPLWMVERLKNYWSYWNKDISTVWCTSQEYTERLLNIWHLSEMQAIEIAKSTNEHVWYYPSRYENKHIWNLSVPNTISEQLILMLRCVSIINSLKRQFPIRENNYNSILIPELNINLIFAKPQPLISISNEISNEIAVVLNSLVHRTDLMDLPKLYFWILFWYINEPNYANVLDFFNYIKNNEVLVETSGMFWSPFGNLQNRPILLKSFECYKKEGDKVINELLPFLKTETQISIAQEFIETSKKIIQQSNNIQQQQIFLAIATKIGLDEIFSELIPLANRIGMKIEILLDAHIIGFASSSSSFVLIECTDDQVKNILNAVEEAIENQENPGALLWAITKLKLPSNIDLLKQFWRMLELMIKRFSYYSESSLNETIITIFIKLVFSDFQVEEVIHLFFTTLLVTDLLTELLQLSFWAISDEVISFSSKNLSRLKSFLNNEQEAVRVGSALILKSLVNVPDNYRETNTSEIQELKAIRLNPDLGWSLIKTGDSQHRLAGIALLSLSDYPIDNVNSQHTLLQLLQQHQNNQEEEALVEFLKQIKIDSEKQITWLNLLEEILGNAWNYNKLILNAAMERYQALTNPTDSKISEAEERALGLL